MPLAVIYFCCCCCCWDLHIERLNRYFAKVLLNNDACKERTLLIIIFDWGVCGCHKLAVMISNPSPNLCHAVQIDLMRQNYAAADGKSCVSWRPQLCILWPINWSMILSQRREDMMRAQCIRFGQLCLLSGVKARCSFLPPIFSTAFHQSWVLYVAANCR